MSSVNVVDAETWKEIVDRMAEPPGNGRGLARHVIRNLRRANLDEMYLHIWDLDGDTTGIGWMDGAMVIAPPRIILPIGHNTTAVDWLDDKRRPRVVPEPLILYSPLVPARKAETTGKQIRPGVWESPWRI